MPVMDRLLTTVRSTHGAGAAQSTRSVLFEIVGDPSRRCPHERSATRSDRSAGIETQPQGRSTAPCGTR
jgi:hypothetical protein